MVPEGSSPIPDKADGAAVLFLSYSEDERGLRADARSLDELSYEGDDEWFD